MELLTRLRRRAYLHRQVLAACLAALSVLLLAHHLEGPGPETSDVVVTTRDVPAGHRLTHSDLDVAAVPTRWVPAGATGALDEAVGSVTATSTGEGTVIQPGLLISNWATAPDRAVVPIQVAPAELVALLTPGTRLSLAETVTGSEVITDDARVVAMPPAADLGNQLTPRVAAAPLVLVDVPAQLAPGVAVLGQSAQLSIILGGA